MCVQKQSGGGVENQVKSAGFAQTDLWLGPEMRELRLNGFAPGDVKLLLGEWVLDSFFFLPMQQAAPCPPKKGRKKPATFTD